MTSAGIGLPDIGGVTGQGVPGAEDATGVAGTPSSETTSFAVFSPLITLFPIAKEGKPVMLGGAADDSTTAIFPCVCAFNFSTSGLMASQCGHPSITNTTKRFLFLSFCLTRLLLSPPRMASGYTFDIYIER
jgi:hypothetical protein